MAADANVKNDASEAFLEGWLRNVATEFLISHFIYKSKTSHFHHLNH